MAGWLNYKSIFFLSVLLLAFVPHKSKWGFYGHKTINKMAVFSLPKEMFAFYKSNIDFITDHAVDPDKRRYIVKEEACRHYIDIDHYYVKDSSVFDVIPKRWNDAVTKYSEDTLSKYGIVPWYIQTMKYRLQKAFEEKNIDLILKYSSEIGHYIADAHVPLHTTENYNGQLTNQHGIHALWETNIVELNADSYNYFNSKATYINNVLDFAWSTVEASHLLLDSVLSIEKTTTNQFDSDKKYSFVTKGKTTVKTYSKEFVQAYNQQLNGMVERRLKTAITAVSSIWYTAWVDAGQPKLETIRLKHEKTQEEEPMLNCIH